MCPTMMELVQPNLLHTCDGALKKKHRLWKDVTASSGCGVSHRTDSVSSSEESPVCWICLDGPHHGATLLQPCGCPRHAHDRCLARWQLQSAGSRKETHCEFCDQQLPDWKGTLTPKCGADAPAVMNVNFDGKTFSFEVKPGMEGYQEFTQQIRTAFALPDDSELNITFTCDEPSTGWPAVPIQPPRVPTAGLVSATSLLTLQGAGAYDAAVHCASVSAARRILQQGCGGAPPPSPTSARAPPPSPTSFFFGSDSDQGRRGVRGESSGSGRTSTPRRSSSTSSSLSSRDEHTLGARARNSTFVQKMYSNISKCKASFQQTFASTHR